MSCYKPLRAFKTPTGIVFDELRRHDIRHRIDIPCGQCIGCRMRRASDWATRIMHESTNSEANCFITLTYGRDQLPQNSSLDHSDWQRFMKRLRKQHAPTRVRFYMCGEYGPLHQRPHYHACLFGIDFTDRIPAGKSESGEMFYTSEQLKQLWTHGNVSVQNLTRKTASYTARYIMTKQLGPEAEKKYTETTIDGEIIKRKPEYAAMSLKPGIGAKWLKKYATDVYPHDYVIIEGKKIQPPKYYDKIMKRQQPDMIEELQYQREVKGKLHYQDNTPERLRVRELVHTARIRNLKRNDQ
ncbi:MAG: replication initiator protein [Microvirus sp.]|nr:MAG: replication initiator protein [Microvirus sp.]